MGPREYHDAIASTQDRAIELARAGASEGTYVVARRQTRGRGRSDHAWSSPDGGLYLSVVLAAPTGHEGLFPLAVGAWLAERLAREYGVPLALKWPNDLLVVEGDRAVRKLAGILVDRVASPAIGAAAVAGVGVNVASAPVAFPGDLARTVATLREFTERPLSPADVERPVVEAALEGARELRGPFGPEEVRSRCRHWLWGVGRRATVDGRPVGRIVGLGDEGELWVEAAGERMPIRAGDLRVDEHP